MLSLLCYCCLTFAASRRGEISLEDVLKFVTKLTLPVGSIVTDDKEVVFSFFDYAFVNNYFGRV